MESAARRRLGIPGRLLDIGCGGGAFLSYAAEKGWAAVGVDINPVALRHAARQSAARVVQGESACIADSAAFDAVCFLQSIEYDPEPDDAIRDAFRVLRPGGIVVIETPNLAFHDAKRVAARVPLAPVHPLRLELIASRRLFAFTPAAIRMLLFRSGFRDVEILPSKVARRTGIAGLLRTGVYALAEAGWLVSGGRLNLAPSMLAVGRKPASR